MGERPVVGSLRVALEFGGQVSDRLHTSSSFVFKPLFRRQHALLDVVALDAVDRARPASGQARAPSCCPGPGEPCVAQHPRGALPVDAGVNLLRPGVGGDPEAVGIASSRQGYAPARSAGRHGQGQEPVLVSEFLQPRVVRRSGTPLVATALRSAADISPPRPPIHRPEHLHHRSCGGSPAGHPVIPASVASSAPAATTLKRLSARVTWALASASP